MTSRVFDVYDLSQVSAPRREATALAAALGFSESRAGQAALIVSELATNLVKHARGGQVVLRPLYDVCRPHGFHPYAEAQHAARAWPGSGIEVLAIDRGPGLDLASARREGYSTAGSLGVGLGMIERQSDQFDTVSQPPLGTIAVARVWVRPPDAASAAPCAEVPLAAISVPIKGESLCGDGWAAHLDTAVPTILVVDGLGHGPAAAEAASLAVDDFDRGHHRTPVDLVNDLHAALRPTRGAAVAAIQFDPERAIARFAGVGNISGALIGPDLKRQSMVSHNGTAGHIAPRVQEFTYPVPRQATIVLHSDGLTAHWNPEHYAGLWSRDPALIAGMLYRDCARGRDDGTIVVAQWKAPRE
jgi:anti-sigma regulatory factor (Ser/Thr protein kinase)